MSTVDSFDYILWHIAPGQGASRSVVLLLVVSHYLCNIVQGTPYGETTNFHCIELHKLKRKICTGKLTIHTTHGTIHSSHFIFHIEQSPMHPRQNYSTHFTLQTARHAKRHNFYTNKFGAKIILPEKVHKL